MRASWIVVLGAVVAGVTACGGEDGGDLFGSGGSAGSSTGGSSAGGSSATGGSGNLGGSAGSGVGGSPSGGSGGVGTGGVTSGGSGGVTTGGSGGVTTGGTGGVTTGGTGGVTTGGTGGTAMGGSGGTGTGGSATGGGGGCTQKVWCKDNDGDSYGSPSGLVYACNKPSTGSWIQQGSKAEACGDCNDGVKNAFPFSSFCGATGYWTGSATSFDYNCDTQEIACSDFPKATTCSIDPNDSTKCLGAGYLPVVNSSSKNKYCGSSQWQDCVPVSLAPDGGGTLGCTPSVKTANHVTCK